MIEINEENIKRADLVIGIPSYNEADNISLVVRQVDEGLKKLPKKTRPAIINVDNHSPDDTKRVFLSTETNHPKIYLSTPQGVKGKGNNLKKLFQKTLELKAKGAIIIDADVKSVTPEWITCLRKPLKKGYDFATPIHNRHKFDGTITNHICYPMVYGLLGYDLRQPIGGEMAFSKKLTKYFLEEDWPESAKKFGIDIFMTLTAIKKRVKISQVDLGPKIHKPSAPKLDFMFLEVASAMFEMLSKNKNMWKKRIRKRKSPTVCNLKKKDRYRELSLNIHDLELEAVEGFKLTYKEVKGKISKELKPILERMFLKERYPEIDEKLWMKILYDVFAIYQRSHKKRELLSFLRALYFARSASFMRETEEETQERAEKLIKGQARYFYKNRDHLLDKVK